MTNGKLTPVSQFLRRIALAEADSRLSDAELLQRFVADQAEPAFAALVRRHGPMVWAVCRRVLHNEHDAEDAFQATFLVLLRRAGSLGRTVLLGGWLHGVAYRTALRVREQSRCFQTLESLPERLLAADPLPELAWRELQLVLDEEVDRLPQKYRAPFVLCYLEGKTYVQAARQLGCSTGTVSKRLAQSREMIRVRLTRRGLGLSAGLLGTVLGQHASAGTVAGALMNSTLEAATTVAAGGAATSTVSANVAALTEGVLKAMFTSKLKMGSVVSLVILLGCLALTGAYHVLGGQQGDDKSRPATSVSGREADASKGGPKRPAAPKVLKLGGEGRRVAWSSDGKTLAVVEKYGKGSAVKLWDVTKGEISKTLAESAEPGLAFQQVTFSADGKLIAAIDHGRVLGDQVVKLWDARTLALTHTLGKKGDRSQCVCVSPDGELVAAGDPSHKAVRLWSAKTGALVKTIDMGEAQPWSLAFSPDSKTLVVGAQRPEQKPGEKKARKVSGAVMTWETATGKAKLTIERDQFVSAVALSPDGKRIVSSGGGGDVGVWAADSGKRVATLEGLARLNRAVAFSPDGETVATGGPDGAVRLWDAATGTLKEALQGHQGAVHSITFSPAGTTLASVGDDQTIRLWPLVGRRK